MVLVKIKFIFLFLSVLIFTNLYSNEKIRDNLNSIPNNDRESLSHLFFLLNRDHFGYTLFGDKPISFSGGFVKPFENLFQYKSNSELFWKYWETWEKYKNLFPSKKFLLIREPSISYNNIHKIILINKKAFKRQVNKYIHIFRKKLGTDLTAEKLLEKIETSQKFASFIKNNELLWGILLGYGIQNASLYSRRNELLPFLYSDIMPALPLKKPLHSPPFSSIEEEFAFLSSKLLAFENYNYTHLFKEACIL